VGSIATCAEFIKKLNEVETVVVKRLCVLKRATAMCDKGVLLFLFKERKNLGPSKLYGIETRQQKTKYELWNRTTTGF
jgi:hypothetical protein